jgi:hypothetical protein
VLRTVLVAAGLIAVGTSATASAHNRAAARAAHTISGNDNATLHYVPPTRGSTLLEEGHASGTIPGHVRAYLRVEATFSGTFTIFTPNGSLTGRGSAQPHGSGAVESFAGTFVIAGGTGRYAHAHGGGRLYGTFKRKNYEVVLQPRGVIHY